ncbi:MAG: metallophosphoesterase [Polyangiaceae bacterium]
MGRSIIVGDVHGCCDELHDLLSYVGFGRSDRLYFVGDLIVRGPKPRATLALVRKLGARAVRGNHEDRLLRWRKAELLQDHGKKIPKKLAKKVAKQVKSQMAGGAMVGRGKSIGPLTRRTADALRKKDWELIESFPLWIDLEEHGVRIVHAGLIPGISIEHQDPRVLMNVRSLTRAGPGWPLEANEERGHRSWAHAYEGPEHVVYGHNAQPAPEIARFATGIDTGAVYGGRLTAMVLREGEPVPPAEHRASVLVSVPSRRAYVEGKVTARPGHRG